MKTIVLIPGLAADHRIFSGLRIEDFPVRVIEFLEPLPGENISAYAKRMSELIVPGEPFDLIGVSFGGIIAQEIARFKTPGRLILISSISSASQLPLQLIAFRYFPLYQWLPGKVLKQLILVAGKMLTNKSRNGKALFESMVHDADVRLVKWSMKQALNWKAPEGIKKVIHLHGSHDRLFPPGKIPADYIINGGEHFMIVEKAGEINILLNRLLKEQKDW